METTAGDQVEPIAPHSHEQTPGKARLWEHWLVAIMLGIIFGMLFYLLGPFAPLRVLERVGSDATAERAARLASDRHWTDGPPLVFVSIDEDALSKWGKNNAADARDQVAALITMIRQSKPHIVLVDMVFVGAKSATADDALTNALTLEGGAPLVLAAPIQETRVTRDDRNNTLRLAPKPPYPANLPKEVSFASASVEQDDDGTVRSLRSGLCVDTGDGWHLLPTLAQAALQHEGLHETETLTCPGRGEDHTIVFLLPPDASSFRDTRRLPWFRTIRAADVATAREALSGAIVIIGQDNFTSFEDRHVTPTGSMPGALIHANALAGWVHVGEASVATRSLSLLIEGCLILIGATAFLPYWILRWALFIRRGFDPERRLAAFLADLGLFIVMAVVTSFLVGFVIIYVGAWLLLSFGVSVGTLAPAMAVLLEALVEIGASVVRWLHVLAGAVIVQLKRRFTIFGRRSTATTGLLALLTTGLASALPQTSVAQPVAFLRVDGGDPASVEVIRNGKKLSGDVILDLFFNDTVRIKDASTIVRICYSNATVQDDIVRGNQILVVQNPGVPPKSDQDYFQTFRYLWDHLMRDRSPVPVSATSMSYRPPAGTFFNSAPSSPSSSSASASPLQPDPLLGAGPFLINSTSDLMLMWSGGKGPFSVQIYQGDKRHNEQLDQSLAVDTWYALVNTAHLSASSANLILVEDRTTGQIVRFLVSRTEVGMQPPEFRDDRSGRMGVRAAAWLFMSPNQRFHLEGLRRLVVLAHKNDPEAKAVIHQIEQNHTRQ